MIPPDPSPLDPEVEADPTIGIGNVSAAKVLLKASPIAVANFTGPLPTIPTIENP